MKQIYLQIGVEEEELPQEMVFTTSEKTGQNKYGEVHKELGTYRCGSLSDEITHWLKPAEPTIKNLLAIPEFKEELENMLGDAFDIGAGAANLLPLRLKKYKEDYIKYIVKSS